MLDSHLGEIAALLTAMCWTVTAMSFESAGKKVGSLPVNLIRLCLAIVFLSVFTFITRGLFLPIDASEHAWIWLSISGLIGFSIGDLFLFQAFVLIGARISMLIMASVPLITTFLGWIIMGEYLDCFEWTGMVLTISGIALVILQRDRKKNHMSFSQPLAGILYAFGGAFGQAIGLVLSKYGMEDYNAFAATQIRIIAGIGGFVILFSFMRIWPNVGHAFRHKPAMVSITIGSIFGPFLGVSFSLLAVQYTATGVASTIMSIVPILIIPAAIIIFREKVTAKEIIGAVIAVLGVALLFL